MVVNTIDITLPNYGTIRGSVDIRRQIAIFRNVPFAHAPVRWRVAVKPQRWTGIRDATIQGPVPPHIPTDNLQIDLIPKEYTTIGTSTNSLHQFGVEHSEEGGLNSNIFVPLSALQEGAASVPVLAFIYGGSYRTGSNAFPLYDARNFVEHSVQLGQPIIVVVPNYRMAAFGFLASKELQQDIDQHIQQSPTPIPAYDQSIGNWGLQDQKLAFEWIRENISEFGGDAKNVTAFGQSVGAISLHYHIVLPAHHGLFDRAILQSGAIGTMSTGTVEQVGQPIFDRLVEILGIPADLSGVEKVRRLREVPVEELTRASDEAGPRFGYRPFHDGGKIFPFNIPVETWADSSFSYDPNLKAVLIGANKEEGYSLDNDFGERTLKTWPHLLNSFVPSPELVPLYEVAYGTPQVDEDVSKIMAEHLGDIVFHYPIERAVDALIQVKQARGDAFSLERYHFEIPTQATLNSHPSSGSMHGGELLFLFNPPMNETVFTPSELSAALEVQKRWISFAYRQPVLSDEGKATRAERDEAIVFTKEYKVEVGKGRRLSEKVMGLWDAALEVRLKDIQASLDASVPKEE
ncbi:Alpha/Beta hydrolase protein [Linnemannia elongata]|nr:Alpha/Beta hydrolase protein [Linnemannia elongata]